MAVNINVLSQWDDKGIRAAQNDLDKLKSKTQATSQKLAQGASLVGAGILAGAGAIGVGLFQIGTQFDDAFDRIRIGTGLTGPALEALQNDMKAVAGSVPATFSDASTAVTEFSKRLNLTGQPLQDLSKQVLELSRMTGTDLKTNIDAVAKVMENFSVAAGDQGAKLDVLFRASQKSGVSVADLAGQMSDAGVVLRDVGFGFDHSAALLATLGKAGVDVGDVMPALSRAMGTAAKQGKDASQVFEETFNKIANAEDPVKGAAEALRVFGHKAGPKLAALIQEGKLSYLDMVDAITNGGDSIMQASADTQDFAEKLTTLKNRVFLAIEPIATRVFNAIGDAVEKLVPKIEELVSWMKENSDTVKIVAAVIGGIMLVVLAAYTASMIGAAAATIAATWPILAIIAAIGLLVAGVIYAYNNFDWFKTAVDTAWQVIQQVIDFAWNNVIKPVFTALVSWIQNSLVPFLAVLWKKAQAVWSAIANVVSWAWNNVIQPAWTAISWYISNILVPYYTFLWNVVKTVFEAIAGVVSWAWNNVIQPAWTAISWYISNILVPWFSFLWSVISKVFGYIAEKIVRVWTDIIQPIWNLLVAYITDVIVPILGILWDVVKVVWEAISAAISWAWNNIIRPTFDLIAGGVGMVIDVFGTVKDGIATAFSTVFDIIYTPFKTAFNLIADAWNNTVGKLSFTVPKWVPVFGGDKFEMPKIPKLHQGGIFQAPVSGGEGLALLKDGEMVLTAQQQQQGGFGGDVNVYVNQSNASPYEIGRELAWTLKVTR